LRVIGVAFITATSLSAQFEAPGLGSYRSDITYDGRFTFVRLRWQSDFAYSRRGGWGSAWNHDYPRAEQNLGLILQELTSLDIRTDGSRIPKLGAPDLFKY